MALKPKFEKLLKVDEQGFVSAKLVKIEEISKDENQFDYEQYKFTFHSDTDGRQFPVYLWTGTKVSKGGVNYFSLDDDPEEEQYSRLTLLMLSLGILNKSDLPEMTESDLHKAWDDLESSIGKEFKFKVKRGKSEAGKPVLRIDLDTIQFAS